MKKILDYLLSIIYLVHFGVTLLVFHVIQVVAFNVFGKKVHKVCVDYLNFFLTYGLYLTGSRISFHNFSVIPENRPVIFVANHQSTFDIPAIIWFLRKYIHALSPKENWQKECPAYLITYAKAGRR